MAMVLKAITDQRSPGVRRKGEIVMGSGFFWPQAMSLVELGEGGVDGELPPSEEPKAETEPFPGRIKAPADLFNHSNFVERSCWGMASARGLSSLLETEEKGGRGSEPSWQSTPINPASTSFPSRRNLARAAEAAAGVGGAVKPRAPEIPRVSPNPPPPHNALPTLGQS